MSKKIDRAFCRTLPDGQFRGAILWLSAVFCAAALLLSCKSSLKIEVDGDSVCFSYTASAGTAFWEAISAIKGNGGGMAAFDAKEIQALFQEAGFADVSARAASENSAAPRAAEIDVSGLFPENRKNAVEESGLFRRGRERKAGSPPSEAPEATLSITAETLRSLYDALPEKMRAYFDLFMAPSFSGEEMSDEEYLDLIATVYGSALADEISAAGISLSLVSSRGRQSATVPLLRLLNFTEPIILRG